MTVAWNPNDGVPNRWIQADLRTRHFLYSITTQGSSDYYNWIISYYVHYGDDGVNFNAIATQYLGNTDQHTKVTHELPLNTIGRFVRLYPEFLRTYGTVRWDVYAGEQI